MVKTSPSARLIGPFLNLPTRIFGPCRSTRIPTCRPCACARSRAASARFMCTSGLSWEKFRRTTSPPASNSLSRTLGSSVAGPRVATIFVLRSKGVTYVYEFLPQRRKGRTASILILPFFALFASWRRMYIILLLGTLFENVQRRQLLAFEEFQERTTGRRDIGHP